MRVAPPAFYSLLHCELSHTNAERGPTVEMPKRLSEPCEEPSTSSPRPHYIAVKRRQHRDSPLLQPLICLTPSHPGPRERTPLSAGLSAGAGVTWPFHLFALPISTDILEERRRRDYCPEADAETDWRACVCVKGRTPDELFNLTRTAGKHRTPPGRSRKNRPNMFPWWWRRNTKDLLFCRGCLQQTILIFKLISWSASSLCDETKGVAVVVFTSKVLAPPLKDVFFSCSPEHVEDQIASLSAESCFNSIQAYSSDVGYELRQNLTKKRLKNCVKWCALRNVKWQSQKSL